jgi:hypothetical protein
MISARSTPGIELIVVSRVSVSPPASLTIAANLMALRPKPIGSSLISWMPGNFSLSAYFNCSRFTSGDSGMILMMTATLPMVYGPPNPHFGQV